MSFTSSSSSSPSCSWTLLTVLLLHLLPPCLLHPQPCHLLAQIGHTVRVGALLPAQRGARVQVQAALSRAAAAMSRDRDRDWNQDQDRDRDRQQHNFLPYNLSLELVSRQPAAADPESLFRCVCQGVVVQGVSAVLAFPQSREELLQVDFMASFLEIPFLSVIEHGEPLRTQVRHPPLCARADPDPVPVPPWSGSGHPFWGRWVSVFRFDLDPFGIWRFL
ncbi:grin3a [Pungitius sinensis]